MREPWVVDQSSHTVPSARTGNIQGAARFHAAPASKRAVPRYFVDRAVEQDMSRTPYNNAASDGLACMSTMDRSIGAEESMSAVRWADVDV